VPDAAFRRKTSRSVKNFQVNEIFLTDFASCTMWYKKLVQEKNSIMFRRMKKIAYETRLFAEKQVVALNFFQIIEVFLTDFASCTTALDEQFHGTFFNSSRPQLFIAFSYFR
jgi:hypothetical protein